MNEQYLAGVRSGPCFDPDGLEDRDKHVRVVVRHFPLRDRTKQRHAKARRFKGTRKVNATQGLGLGNRR